MVGSSIPNRSRAARASVVALASLVLAGAGCGWIISIDDPDFMPPDQDSAPVDPATTDAGADVDTGQQSDASADCSTWAAAHFDPCALPAPQGSLTLGNGQVYRYDTGDQILLDTSSNEPIPHIAHVVDSDGENAVAIVVAGFRLDAGAQLHARGNRALMIVSFGDIEIAGLLDLSAHIDGDPAGARNNCPDDAGNGSGIDYFGGDGGGGGGGGFGSPGERGGTGSSVATFDGGDGGQASPRPDQVLGGCDGGNGFGAVGGSGGDGGGAVLLSARDTLTISGGIHAGGEGGDGGGQQLLTGGAGGGGGGSGGLIELEAAFVTTEAEARLAANGGGGGEGGSNSGGGSGHDGDHADFGTTPAAGGAGGNGSGGAPGGAAAAGASDAEPGLDGDDGGGGGGGGVGYILIRSTNWDDQGAEIVPAAQSL